MNPNIKPCPRNPFDTNSLFLCSTSRPPPHTLAHTPPHRRNATGCGGEYDLVAINAAIKAAGKPIMVENCHWGRTIPDRTKPPAEGCPWNFYRSSGDVRASYASIRGNLQTTVPLAAKNLSYPGCWAYPDMLQVGCKHGPGGKNDPGLTLPETKTHFYAWSIVSSPLTLSHDVNDPEISKTVWPIITNTEALAVSKAYVDVSL